MENLASNEVRVGAPSRFCQAFPSSMVGPFRLSVRSCSFKPASFSFSISSYCHESKQIQSRRWSSVIILVVRKLELWNSGVQGNIEL